MGYVYNIKSLDFPNYFLVGNQNVRDDASYHDLRAVASTVAQAEHCLEFPLME